MQQTPQTWIDGLETQPMWPDTPENRRKLPIWDVMEDNFDMIKTEIAELYKDGKKYDPAYRFLFKNGTWDQLLLFNDRKWGEEPCKLVPKICALLSEALPKREVHHYPWMSAQGEQVIILRIAPGTDMETHCGPANNILNVHLGVSGLEGAVLRIANETYAWEEGKVIPWDGSYDHSVHCKDCKQDRVIMMVRYMHPDMKKEHYIGSAATHYEPVPKDFYDDDWLSKKKKRDEEEKRRTAEEQKRTRKVEEKKKNNRVEL